MSTIGKGQLSLRKKDVLGQKSLAVGFSKIVFAHKATGGETSINFASLTAPSEMLSQGFVQPSLSALSDLNIYIYRRNLLLESSLRGKLIDFLSYNITSNTSISLSFDLEPGEIIVGTIDPLPRNDLQVVDGEAIAATGTLAAGITDFNVGTPFEINKYPLMQIGAVKVYRGGLLQARCEGNVLTGEGNYIEVPVTGGFGTLIRFKTPGSPGGDAIIVTSNGAYFERPADSMMAPIEMLGSQMDKVVEVLSAVSGLAESVFTANPNQVNLREFGDRVLDAETAIETIKSTVVRGPTKAVEYRLTDNTNNLLHTQGLKFNPALFTVTGDLDIVSIDNTSNTTKWVATKKIKLHGSCRLVISDNTATAAVTFYKNEIVVGEGNWIKANPAQSSGHVTMILNPGEYFSIRLPLGIATAAAALYVMVVAESLAEDDTIEDLA